MFGMTFPVKRYCKHIILKQGKCHHLLLWGVFSRDKFNRSNKVNMPFLLQWFYKILYIFYLSLPFYLCG